MTLGHENALGTGTLFVTESGGLLGGGTLTIGNAIELDGELRFVNTTFTMTGDMQVGVDSEATAPLALTSNNRLTVFEGVISDGGHNRSLAINRGLWIFANNNTLTGDITVETAAGSSILQIGDGGATGLIGTSAVTLEDETTLRFDRTGSYTAVNAISGEGSLEIQGGGNATFTGALTHEGTTTVTGSSAFRVDGSFNGGDGISIAAGSTFGGAGSVELALGMIELANGAFLAPGGEASLGVLNLDSSVLDLSEIRGEGYGALVFRLAGVSNSDRVDFGGSSTLIIGGGAGEGLIFDDFDFSLAAGFTGGDYILFEDFSTAGPDDILTAGQTTGFINGFEAELFLDGDNLMLTVIPEPGTMAAILGALALGLVAWRRRQSRQLSR